MSSGITRNDAARRQQTAQPAVQKETIKKAEAPKTGILEGAKATATAKATPKNDFFSDVKNNVFAAIKKNLPSIQEAGKKLLDNPQVKAALGDLNPAKLIDSAKGEAKKLINDKLTNLEWAKNPPKFEKAGEKGKNLPGGLDTKGFVEKGLSGPGELGIKPTKTGSKEVTLGDGQRGIVDRAGNSLGKVQDGFAKAQDLAKLAEKVGIKVPSYDKSAETGSTKNLYTSADGKGTVDASTNAKGTFHAGVDGIKATGEASVGVTATRSDSVSAENKYGKADASYTATATAGAKATGSATLDANGLNAQGRVEVGVSAKVEGQAKVESKPIGGVPGLTATAGVKGQAEVGASAYAEGGVKLSGNPPTAVVSGKAGAFAGARASVEANAGIGPVGANVKAEGWAGIGAEAHFDAGYKDGKLKLDFGIGAALGIGGKIGGGITIDVGKAKEIAGHVIDKVGDAAVKVADADGDGKLSLNDAKVVANNVGKAVSTGVKAVGNAVESGVKAVGNAVGNAVDSVGKGISNVGKGISNFAKKFSIF